MKPTDDPSEEDNCALSQEDAADIAAAMFPDPITQTDPTTCDEAVLEERLAFSEGATWLAHQTGDATWQLLANAAAAPATHALNALFESYRDVFPGGALRPAPEAAIAALRGATAAAMTTEARTLFELAWKVRMAVLVGGHVRLRRQFPDMGAAAAGPYADLRATLRRIPNRLMLDAFLRRLRASVVGGPGRMRDRDERFVLAAIDEAPQAMRASIADDAARLDGLDRPDA